MKINKSFICKIHGSRLNTEYIYELYDIFISEMLYLDINLNLMHIKNNSGFVSLMFLNSH